MELAYKAIEIAEQIDDKMTLFHANNAIGINLHYLEDLDGAHSYYNRDFHE